MTIKKSNNAKFSPSGKGRMIASTLRRRIINGDFLPKERIPRREDLINEFDASSVTVQKALSTLGKDGFIVSKGKLGTFVTDKPPHLNQFALVFPMTRDSQDWGLFWDHLAQAAEHIVTNQGLKLKIYTGIDSLFPGEDYEKLLDDVRHERLAGIIFSAPPFRVGETDIVKKTGIPRVIMAENHGLYGNAAYVYINSLSFTQKAVKFLQEKKCESTAILQTPQMKNEELLEELTQAGIDCPYKFRQAISLDNTEWAKNCMRLMFDKANTNRPESLILLDDNLFEPALAGILDAGINIPADLEIITHSNFPWKSECKVSVTRLGFDMHSLLELFLAELESQRNGNPPQDASLEAVFEEEIKEARSQIMQSS